MGDVDDPLGMDGATVSVSTTFADGATWQDTGFESVIAVADSHSFTISGASVASSNGVFSDPNGLLLEAVLGVQTDFLSLPFMSGDSSIFLGGGAEFVLGFSLSAVAFADQPDVGDFIDSSHFASTFAFDDSLHDTLASSAPVTNVYEISHVVSAPSTTGGPTNPDVSPVPLPAGLPLIASSLALLAVLGRRSSKPFRKPA